MCDKGVHAWQGECVCVDERRENSNFTPKYKY